MQGKGRELGEKFNGNYEKGSVCGGSLDGKLLRGSGTFGPPEKLVPMVGEKRKKSVGGPGVILGERETREKKSDVAGREYRKRNPWSTTDYARGVRDIQGDLCEGTGTKRSGGGQRNGV